MALYLKLKCLLIASLIAVSSQTQANSTQNIYTMTLSILSYVKWEPTKPNLCVINDLNVTQQLFQASKIQKNTLKIETINNNEIETKHCDAIFFTETTPQSEQKLINRSKNSNVLSFSRSNPDCEIGSTFCLYASKAGSTLFKVNLDSLAKSKIHIDPRVLLLARNSE